MSGHDTDKKTDVEWVNLVDAVRALKAARTGIVNARESLQHHQGALKDAESAVYKALVRLGERRVVLGDELIELYDHPGESLVRIVPTLVAS